MSKPGYRPRVADRQLAERLLGLGAVAIDGDVSAAQAARVDPRLWLAGPVPRLIDEWQREPRVWDAVRRAVDDRGEAGQFILTGSATPRDDVVRHSGAGRISVLRMRTMTLVEQGVATSAVSTSALLAGDELVPARSEIDFETYVERVVVGGWPQLLGASEDVARQFLAGYLDTIVDVVLDDRVQIAGEELASNVLGRAEQLWPAADYDALNVCLEVDLRPRRDQFVAGQQRARRHRGGRDSLLDQRHGPHPQDRDPARSGVPYDVVARGSRAGKDELARFAAVIDRTPDCVPDARFSLPLIYEAGNGTREH